MLGSVFYFVLNMSITAALIIAILLVIRGSISRWIPKSWIYSLWGIALFRLLVPVSVPSGISLVSFISGYITKAVAVPKASEILPNFTTLNSIKAVNQYFPLQYKSTAMETIFTVSGIVWICGAAAFVIASIVIYRLTSLELRKAVLIRNNDVLEICRGKLNIKGEVRLFESGFVASPVVLGIMKPRIIIPKDIPREALQYALLHELSHIKRHDNLWKLFSVFAVCIHWFNPFVWLAIYISGRDMEFACDAKVLKAVEGDIRKPYAEALASLAVKQRTALTAFGATAVRQRIMNIVVYKRISIIMAVTTAIICIALAVILITNPIL